MILLGNACDMAVDTLETYISSDCTARTDDGKNCKLYKRRWFMLILFIFYGCSCNISWILYAVIADKVVSYYGISYMEAEWTTLVFIVEYIILFVPISYLIDKLGIRWSVIIGIIGVSLGSLIKLLSVEPSRFWVLILGQAVTGIFLVITSSLPSKVAAVWFGSHEVSKASTIALFGIWLSAVIAYLVAPVIVQQGTAEEIATGLHQLALGVAIFNLILLPVLLVFFQDSPPTPPSYAQLNLLNNAETNFFKSWRRLASNKSFVFFLIAFGNVHGMDYVIHVSLNHIILLHYPNAASDVGYMGAMATASGIMGSIAVSFILDKFKAFRKTTIFIFALYLACFMLFTSILNISILAAYFAMVVFGFVSVSLFAISIQVAVELTYPEPENATAALLTATGQTTGLLYSTLYAYLLSNSTELIANITMYVIMISGSLLLILIKFDLRRQNADKYLGLKVMPVAIDNQ